MFCHWKEPIEKASVRVWMGYSLGGDKGVGSRVKDPLGLEGRKERVWLDVDLMARY